MSSSNSSTTFSSDTSPRSDEQGENEDWDEEEEDEMILELREVWRQSTSTVSVLEDTGDSLDGEDTEEIKAKLRALREYVNDLQSSYDELLDTFSQLESAARQRMNSLENKLSTALSSAKEFQDRCMELESKLENLKNSQTDDDEDAKLQIQALEDDLSAVLKAITEGVEGGVMKLSNLHLTTQEYPLPLQDVVLNQGVHSKADVLHDFDVEGSPIAEPVNLLPELNSSIQPFSIVPTDQSLLSSIDQSVFQEPVFTATDYVPTSDKLSISQSVFTSTSQPVSSQSVFTSTDQPVSSQPVFTSTDQPVFSQSVFTSTDQPVFTSTDQPVFSQSVFTSTSQPVSSQPVFTSTDQPVFTSTDQPVFSQSVFTSTDQPVFSQSVFTSTSQPVSSQSVFASTSQPVSSQSVFTSTDQPVTFTSTSQPVSSQSVFASTSQSVFTSTDQPVFTSTDQPMFTSTSQPVSSQSVFTSTDQPVSNQPVFTSTDQPVSSQPVFTSTDQPVFTSTSQPVSSQSVFTSTSQPVLTSTDQPVFTSTSQPVSNQSVFTSTDQPVSSQPVFTSTSQPVSSQPVFTSTSQPVSSQSVFASTSQPVSNQSVFTSTDQPVSSQPVFTSTSQPVSSQSVFTSTDQPVSSQSVFTSTSQSVFASTSQPVPSQSVFTSTDQPVSGQPVFTSTDQPVFTSTDQPVSGQPVFTSTDQPVSSQPVFASTDQPVSSQPVFASTDQPMSGQSVFTSTSQPVFTSTDQPVSGQSVFTSTNQPVSNQPVFTSTDQPVFASTSQPVSSQSVVTSTDQPVFASTNQPVSSQSVVTSTDQPGFTSTDQPVFTSTSQPVSSQSVFTSTGQPVFTSTDQPVFTSTDQPVSSQPVFTSTDQPVSDTNSLVLQSNNDATKLQYESESPHSPVILDGKWLNNTRDSISTPILERDCIIADLETRIQELEYQLQESEHSNLVTQSALKDAETTIRSHYLTSVINKEDNASGVSSEIDQLKVEKAKLCKQIEDDKEKIKEIEKTRDTALKEVQLLQHQIDNASSTKQNDNNSSELQLQHSLVKTKLALQDEQLSSLSIEKGTLLLEKDTLQQSYEEVEDKVTVLEGALRVAKHETNRLQAATTNKESELKRLLLAINACRIQLSNMSGEHSINDVSNVDQLVTSLETDIASLKKRWEELTNDLVHHESCIAELIGKEVVLASELDQRNARVTELEALVQSQQLTNESINYTLGKSHDSIELLKSDLSETKQIYNDSCSQMRDIQLKLNKAVVSLVDKLRFLRDQVKDRDERVVQLEKNHHELYELYTQTNYCLKEGESLLKNKELKLEIIEVELLKAKEDVEKLEALLEKENQDRLNDIDYEKAILQDICNQLAFDNEEMSQSTTATTLQAKLSQRDHLLHVLQEETSQLLRNHTLAVQEVNEHQKLVKELENKLKTSQILCEALEGEVSNSQNKLTVVSKRLTDSQLEKAELKDQVMKLQAEAEQTCHDLEDAVHKNSLLRLNKEKLESFQTQLETEKSIRCHLELKIEELVNETKIKEQEMKTLRETISNLEQQNTRLKLLNSRNETALTNLHEQLDDDSSKYQTMHKELANSIGLINELKSQAMQAKLKQELAEKMSEERLTEINQLQEQLQHVCLLNNELESKLHNGQSNYGNKLETLEDKTDTLKTLYESKCIELEKVKSEYHSLIEKDDYISKQLEECHKELEICKRRATELDVKYQESLQKVAEHQREMKDLRSIRDNKHEDEKDTNRKNIKTLSDKVVLLQSQLCESNQRLKETESALQFREEERTKLLHKLSTLEEQYATLVRNHSQQKSALSRSQSLYEKQHKKYSSLQCDYDNITDQIGQWADSQRSSSEALIKKIKEQDREISALKSQRQLLQAENDKLKDRMQATAPSNNSTVKTSPSLDSTLHKLNFHYQATLEKGLSNGASVMDTSGYSSPAESSDDLDKAYWIRRAGELSLQLQESSEYWSSKVREQSLKLQNYES